MEATMEDYLRQPLTDHATAKDFIARAIHSTYEDEKFKPVADYLASMYQAAVDLIFEFCESPIEQMLFNSTLFSSVRNGTPIRVLGPQKDFVTFHQNECDFLEKAFECYSFYKNLPSDAKPKTFRDFLEGHVGEADLTPETADNLDFKVALYHELNFLNCFHLTLQPTICRSKEDGGNIRPDAAFWMPSKPSLRIAVECDGYEFHSSKDSFVTDRRRDRWLSDNGFLVRRYSGSEIYKHPPMVSSELWGYLLDAHYPDQDEQRQWRESISGRAKPSPECIKSWRLHLEGGR